MAVFLNHLDACFIGNNLMPLAPSELIDLQYRKDTRPRKRLKILHSGTRMATRLVSSRDSSPDGRHLKAANRGSYRYQVERTGNKEVHIFTEESVDKKLCLHQRYIHFSGSQARGFSSISHARNLIFRNHIYRLCPRCKSRDNTSKLAMTSILKKVGDSLHTPAP